MYPYKHDGLSTLDISIIKKYIKSKNKYVFIESGTNLGAGVQSALDSDRFKKIYSIEIEKDFYDAAIHRFKHNENVNIIFGDANVEIPMLCEKIKEPILFFSDGHNLTDSSVIRDIQCIIKRNNKKDILAIDDIRIFIKEDLWAKKVSFQTIINLLTDNTYNISFEDTYNEKQDMLIAIK
jgi:hypothetical protein